MKPAAIAFLVSAIAASSTSAATQSWSVSENGAGPVRLGMTIEQATRVAGPISPRDDVYEDSCEYRALTRAPGTLAFMFNDGILVRIDVNKPGVPTAEGVAVGDDEAKIAKVYRGRRIKVDPHPYVGDDGHYVTVFGRTKDRRLVFETDKGVITNLRIGFNKPAQYIEGCS